MTTKLVDHCTDWSGTLTTRSGLRVVVRPASPADTERLKQFFAHVGPESLRFRFLTGLNRVGEDQIRSLAHVDHQRSENFLAFHGENLVATAMIVADDSFESAEVAIVERDDYRNRGLGWTLLQHVAHYASARGLKRLHSVESRANRAAIELEREMGFQVRPFEGDSTLVVVEADLAKFKA